MFMQKLLLSTAFICGLTVSFSYSMNLSIKQALDQEYCLLQLKLSCCESLSRQANEAHCQYGSAVTQIVLNSGSLMSKAEKLNHLWGDDLFEERKKIATDMIVNDKIHPNKIQYHGESLLYDSFTHKDVEFITFLFKHTAFIDDRLARRVEDYPHFRISFLEILKKVVNGWIT